jgi:hypothetical protein
MWLIILYIGINILNKRMVIAQKVNNDNNLNTEGVLVKTSRIAQHLNTTYYTWQMYGWMPQKDYIKA